MWSRLYAGAAGSPLDDGDVNCQHASSPEGFELPAGVECSV